MTTRDEKATASLKTIECWQWQRCDPDGTSFEPGRMIDDVINRLAMDGRDRPDIDVLRLLCRGELRARGFYRWRKYQHGQHFQREGSDNPISERFWNRLESLIHEHDRVLGGDGWPEVKTDLEELGFTDIDIWVWEAGSNRFSTAECLGDHSKRDATYSEEWFSAWDISVWPTSLTTEPAADSALPESNAADKGGRPPVANWEAAVLELSGRYYLGDFKPTTLGDVKRALAEYLAAENVHPADSTIGNHAKPIFEAFQAWEQDTQKPG